MGKLKHLNRRNLRDIWTAVGVILVTAAILYALPERDPDLPGYVPLTAVAIVAGVVVFFRWRAAIHRHRRGRHHHPRHQQ